MTFQKVDFLIGFHSQYDVLHHFTRKLYEAGLRAGLDCRILDRQEMQNLPKHSPPDLSIGFNGIPRNAQDVLLCDVFKIPYLSILVDPPYRFWYVTKSPYSLVSCDDQYGCKLLDQVNFRRSFFLPHGVEPELEPDPNVKKVFDTVMLTTFIDFEAIKENWKNLFPPVICKVMEEAAEIAFFEPRISFIASFNTLLDEAQSKNPPQLFENVLMTRVLEELEIYIKGKDKYLLATSIKEATLHIFGDTISKKSWKDYLGKNHPNIFPHGPVSFSQALEIIKQSKVLLNANIKNKEGAHERIFAGSTCHPPLRHPGV